MKASTAGSRTGEAGGYWLEKNNSEYDQIHYYLKACVMDQGDISKLEIWKIENLDLSFRYDRRTTNMLKLASWMNSNTLVNDNTIESVCNRGYSFARTLNNGLEFSNGVIDFNNADEIGREYSFIYSEIAVGRSFVQDGDFLRSKQTQPCVPLGYDSLYVPEQLLDRDQDGKFSLTEYQAAANFDNRDPREYRHKYFIQDPQQVHPKYIVRFKLTPNTNLNGQTSTPTKNTNPDLFQEDTNDYCYYDPVNYTPLTKQQRQQYNLSTGVGHGNAALLSIEASFSSALESHYQIDPVVESKKAWLNRQMETVEDKVREVNLNYAEISEAIQEAAAAATLKLQALTKQKLQTCLSVEIELKRQQEQLDWLDSAITAQLNDTNRLVNAQGNAIKTSSLNKKKLDFLKSFKYHSMFRTTLSRSKPNEVLVLNTIHADIKINPNISIYLDPFFTGGASEGKASHGDSRDNMNGNNKNDSQFGGEFMRYSRDAVTNKLFAVPSATRPMYPLVSNTLQSVINDEMDTITGAIQEAIDTHSSFPLPDSILRPMITGERYEPQLHEILRGLVEADEGRENTKTAFEAAMRTTIGETVQHAHGTSSSHQPPLPQDEDHPLPSGASALSALDQHSSYTPSRGGGGGGFVEGVEPPPQPYYAQTQQNQAHSPAPNVQTPNKRGTPGRASIIMKPSHHNHNTTTSVTGPPPSTPPTPHSNMSNHHRSGSPVANDRLFHSAVVPGQAVKSMSASGGAVNQHDHYAHSDTSELDLERVHMSITQLLRHVAPFSQYSLSDISSRKKRQLAAKGITSYDESVCALLNGSKVVSSDRSVAERVFLTLPFFATPPQVKLLYSTDLHNRALRELFQKTDKHRGPSFMLIRSGDFVFGAYFSHALTPGDNWAGSPACYLFSITLDIKLPYHARAATSAEFSDIREPLAFFVQNDSIFLGNGDLSIDETIENGSTEVENCYGVGLEAKSTESMCLLAGSPLFAIDELEVWAVIS